MSQLGCPPKLPPKRIPKKNAEHIQQLVQRNEQLAKNNMRLKALLKENGINEPDSIEELMVSSKTEIRNWSYTIICCLQEKECLLKKVEQYEVAGKAVLNGCALPKNIEKDLQSFQAEVPLKGRHLFLYDGSLVKKVQADVKRCSVRYLGEVLDLKTDFDKSCYGRMCSTIERIKNEIKTKYSENDAELFLKECKRKYSLYKADRRNNERHFDSFPFEDIVL